VLQRTPGRYTCVASDQLDGRCEGQFHAFVLRSDYAVGSILNLVMGDEPLRQRARAFHKRALPRRVLHFTSGQMYFECVDDFRSEDGYRVKGRYSAVYESPEPAFQQPLRKSLHSENHSIWYHNGRGL
jgi:hypothetical protein